MTDLVSMLSASDATLASAVIAAAKRATPARATQRYREAAVDATRVLEHEHVAQS